MACQADGVCRGILAAIGVRYGCATMDDVHSSDREGAAPTAAPRSFTTWCRSPLAAPPMLRTSLRSSADHTFEAQLFFCEALVRERVVRRT